LLPDVERQGIVVNSADSVQGVELARQKHPVASGFISGGTMSIRWIFAVLWAALACGCTSLEISPRDGDLVSGTGAKVPVTIKLAWPSGGLGMGPVVWLDGARMQTSAFTFTSSGATAIVELPPGSHSVRVRTAQLCWVCVGGVGEFDYTRRFYVESTTQPVSLTVTPSLIALVDTEH
jgi:hypothetical protein